MNQAAIIGLLVLGLGLGVGVLVYDGVETSLNAQKPTDNGSVTPNAATINATIDKVTANTWAAFDLSTITPIIAGATLVLGAVSWLGRSVE